MVLQLWVLKKKFRTADKIYVKSMPNSANCLLMLHGSHSVVFMPLTFLLPGTMSHLLLSLQISNTLFPFHNSLLMASLLVLLEKFKSNQKRTSTVPTAKLPTYLHTFLHNLISLLLMWRKCLSFRFHHLSGSRLAQVSAFLPLRPRHQRVRVFVY